jgi:2-oxoglutarate ferredoxin oxidoreductase subunit alpha
MYERPLEATLKWIKEKFGKKPEQMPVLKANTQALKAGYNYGETVEALPVQYQVAKAQIAPGTYRKITGNDAAVLGFVAAGQLAKKTLVYAGYPITPASSVLEGLTDMRPVRGEDVPGRRRDRRGGRGDGRQLRRARSG